MADKLNNAGAPADGPQIGLQKIYLKDASFEAPNSPSIFTGEWKPQITLNLSTRRNDLGEDNVEVVLELTLEAKQGETIALVGQSGSGKTTLANLINRFYDVADGAIEMDGIDIRQLRIHDLRKLIGYISQDPILFNDTIRNNLQLGNELAGGNSQTAACLHGGLK